MSKKLGSKPRERIIPIQMETEDDDDDFVQDHQKKEEDPVEPSEPSTSGERIAPVAQEAEDQQKQEDDEQEEISQCPLDVSVNTTLESSSQDEENTSEKTVEGLFQETLPVYNVKEKIILVIDSAEDENFTPFRLKNAQMNKPLEILKRAVEIFLHNKEQINKKHEYALAILNHNDVVWLTGFTSNTKEIINAVQKINSCTTEDIFELERLFSAILEHVTVPELSKQNDLILPPPYVVRTILLYGRSYTMPKLSESEEITNLLESPFFTLDVLMTHEPVDNNNNCNKIFNVLQNLDKKGFAYFFPVARNAKNLFGAMGKLLAHPLQRTTQQLADYSIKE